MPDVAARVVAWHNRHPLARRIAPEDIGPVGVVALPFATAAPAAGSAAGAAVSATAAAHPRPLFGADWLYRAPRAMAARLGAWVRAHGVVDAAAFDGWPRRQVDAELPLSHAADADGLTGRTLQHVLSTVVDVHGQRRRVLVAPLARQGKAPVFGARQWSMPRMVGAAGLTAALVAWAAATAVTSPLPGAPAAAPRVADLSTPDAGPPAAALVPAAPPAGAAADPPLTAPAAVAPTGTARNPSPAQAARPASGTPTDASVPLARPGARPVDVRPRLSDAERQAARETSERARAEFDQLASQRAAAARATTAAPGVATAVAVSGPVDRPRTPRAPAGAPGRPDRATSAATVAAATSVPAAAVPVTGPLYAIATRPLASRSAAEAQQALLQALVATHATAHRTQLDVMQAGGQWRAVWWPHTDRDLAEGLLLLARQRGLSVELVAF